MHMTSYKEGMRCRVGRGYINSGKEGWCYGYFDLEACWVIVVLDGEICPRVYRLETLEQEITTVEWRALER